LRGFTKIKKKHLLKISAVYLIGKAEICQDPLAGSKMIRPFHEKKSGFVDSGFVDSGFVKTCDELVIGLWQKTSKNLTN
jgi:hypothetical protein